MHTYSRFKADSLIGVFSSFMDSEFAPLITHSLDVAKLSSAIASRLGHEGFQRPYVYLGGLLHDWGLLVKNAVRDPQRFALSLGASAFPTKGESRAFDFDYLLNELEADDYNRHAVISSSILRYIEVPELYSSAVRHHHDRAARTDEDSESTLLARVYEVADEISRLYRKSLSGGRSVAYHAIFGYLMSGTIEEPLRAATQATLVDVVDMNYCLDSLPHADRYFGTLDTDLPGFIRLIETLSFTQDYRSPFTRNHSFSIATLAHDIGCEALSQRDGLELRLAGLIHDFGKITIPLEILHKPGRLELCEMEIMKGHVVESFKMIDPIIDTKDILLAAVYHHERLDGSGYPFGLRGTDLSMRARIIQVCDNYVALVEERPYRRALPPADAIAIIEAEVLAGRLDPDVFAILRSFVRNGYVTGKYRELLNIFLENQPDLLGQSMDQDRTASLAE